MGPTVSESELSSTLRRCNYSVDRAAECLILGMTTTTSSSPATTPAARQPNRTDQAPIDLVNDVYAAMIDDTCARDEKVKHEEYQSIDEYKAPANPCIDLVASNIGLKANAESSGKKQAKLDSNPVVKKKKSQNGCDKFLLCSRWVVGFCTSRVGCVNYNENFELSSSSSGAAMIRFVSSRVEGTLPQSICAMLAPLLRNEKGPLISLTGCALMEDRYLRIGSEVPMNISIFLEQPLLFFDLFDAVGSNTNSNQNNKCQQLYLKSANRVSKKKLLPAVQAAYSLIEWAEYGDNHILEKFSSDNRGNESCNSSDDEFQDISGMKEGEDVRNTRLLPEEDFKPETDEVTSDTTKLTKDILCSQSVNKVISNLPEMSDPDFKGDLTLRCYQRQALHWMMMRESEASADRDELEKELKFLAELAIDTKLGSRKISSLSPMRLSTSAPISCECGPVIVTEEVAEDSTTLDGVQNVIQHPLWKRRFLATPDLGSVYSFYVSMFVKD